MHIILYTADMSFLVACAMMNCLNFLKFAEAEAVAFAMM
jgi:hypothetical protein